jgi:hypothetical protein
MQNNKYLQLKKKFQLLACEECVVAQAVRPSSVGIRVNTFPQFIANKKHKNSSLGQIKQYDSSRAAPSHHTVSLDSVHRINCS